jgi:NitT/TauT family transport system substrate-binding protein
VRRLLQTFFIAVLAAAALLTTQAAKAAEKTTFNVAWSIYVGWMPWDYAQSSGILKKWADKYGITIKLTQMDYIESINQYTAGKFDGCVMTNMDMLTIPSAGGVDSTALIVGDYSNGNDGVVLKGAGKKLADIKGQSVNLVELSVSHYLLARGLESVGLAERDIKVVNTSDADIVSAFATPGVTATVTWKPQLSEVTAMPKSTLKAIRLKANTLSTKFKKGSLYRFWREIAVLKLKQLSQISFRSTGRSNLASWGH